MSKNDEILVKVSHMTKKFGDLLVLNDISFDVRKGEFMCVVGPTGCGKTTFLNCLTKLGVYQLTSGEILINGEPVDLAKHNVSYIFQEYSAFPWQTVEENVAYGLKIKKWPKDKMEKQVNEMLAMVGLTEYRKYYPSQLSASMLQRVSIARAFATQPDLLLMDEPYGQMDIKMRFFLEDEVIKLWKATGATVLFITHNLEEAVYLAERVLVLSAKPATIKAQVPINIERPRKVSDPAFIEVRKQITDMIKWW